MSTYKEPAFGSPQVLWDIDDAITMLMAAAQLIRDGKNDVASDALKTAVFSAGEAVERITDELELAQVMGAAA